MRMLAFVLMMLSALWFGLELSRTQKDRLDLLYSVSKLTDFMRSELSGRPCGIDELCKKAAETNSGQTQRFLIAVCNKMKDLGDESFRGIWSNCCKEELQYLNSDELGIITALGDSLGSFELSSQLLAMENCSKELKNKYQKLKEEYPNNKKLCIALPCTASCMILLLMI